MPLQPDWLNFNRFTLRAEKTLPLGPLRWASCMPALSAPPPGRPLSLRVLETALLQTALLLLLLLR